MEYTGMQELTEKQKAKLKALYEAVNPKPRNRAERRAQQRKNRKRR